MEWDKLDMHRALFKEWQDIVNWQCVIDRRAGCICPEAVAQMTNAGTDWVSFGVELRTHEECPVHTDHGWTLLAEQAFGEMEDLDD